MDDTLNFTRAFAVTTSDSQDFAPVDAGFSHASAFIPTTTGVIKITTAGGDTVTVPVNAGVVTRIAVRRFWATGNTAGNIIALG